MKNFILTVLILITSLFEVNAQELDFKELDLPYWPLNNTIQIIKSETEYQAFLRASDNSQQPLKIDFDNYYLVGRRGIDNCDESHYNSQFSVDKDQLVITMFINQGYCMNLIYYKRWFLINKKFAEKKIGYKEIEVTAVLTEVRANCDFNTKFQKKSLIIRTDQEFNNLFKQSGKSCLEINFNKYALIREFSMVGGCGYPTMIKTATIRNDSLIIQSRIVQIGLCKRGKIPFITTFQIEKTLLNKKNNIGFTEEISIDWK